MRYPAGRQCQPGTGEISRRPAVKHSGFQAGIEKVLYQIVPTGAVGKA